MGGGSGFKPRGFIPHVPGASAVCAGPCCVGGLSVKLGVHSKGK